MNTRHVLAITAKPDPGDGVHPSFTIECPGVTDACRCWWECTTCKAADIRHLEDIGDDVAHGVRHEHVGDNGWSTPSDDCLLQISEYTPDVVHDLVYGLNLEVGRYPIVKFLFEDGVLPYLKIGDRL
jgi:hypothetical protein